MSNFSLMGTAFSGLQAAQAGMLITSQNVAGSAVDGYSRRRSEVVASSYSLDSSSSAGTVFSVEGFSRDYSRLLELQRGKQHGNMAKSDALVKGTSTLDAVVLDSASSVGAALDKFYASAGALARDPNSISFKAEFFGNAKQLVERVNGAIDSVNAIKDGAQYGLTESLQNANRMAAELANVNQKISESTGFGAAGASPDLLDRRDQLLMSLQEEIGGQAVVGDDGSARLYLNGNPIVDHGQAASLSYAGGRIYLAVSSNAQGVGITLQGNAAGRARANFDLLNTFVPELEDRIGAISKNIADGVNSKLTGMQPTSATGMNLFSYVENPTTGAISEFAVRPELDTSSSTILSSEGTAIEALRQDPSGPIKQWADFTTYVGGTISAWKADFASAQTVSSKLDQDHENISGVNLDEEAANLIKFQQLYGASSKVLQVGGQLFDQLLNILN